ncbi:unnamed protein product [Brassica oleracea var. botrytis]
MNAGMNWKEHGRKIPKENLDRFIPNRSAMDFDFAHHALTEALIEARDGKKKEARELSPSKEAYRKRLAETLGLNRTRILAFRNKPQPPLHSHYHSASLHQQPLKPRRRRIPQSCSKVLDAPNILDDFYLNLLDWGSRNVLAIALGHTLCLWDASTGSVSEFVTIEEDQGPITSISWAPDGSHVALGLNNSQVQLWDSSSIRKIRTLNGIHHSRVGSLAWNNHILTTGGMDGKIINNDVRILNNSQVQLWDSSSIRKIRTLNGVHHSRVGSLAWNNHILTTGGMDGKIINNDVRIRSHVVGTYRGHTGEICGLKWSGSGMQLASGGNDNVVHVWDRSSASSRWLHRLEEHTSAVKALAWCPFQSNLLATGGGGTDGAIKFWNTHTGACLNSVDTGSQVCALLWSKNDRELLSSHGFSQNHLALWKYPSLVKMAELTGHTSRVLYMTQSPDGSTVASAAGDESSRFWDVFGMPDTAKKPDQKAAHEPFSPVPRIR